MPKMTFEGNLTSILDDLAFAMVQLYVTDGGTRVTFDQSGFSLITLFGDGALRVPSSGGEFMTGTIDDLRFNETTIDGLVIGRPLLIENMNLKAEKLFDLLYHIPGGNFGSADSNAFSNYLDNKNWTLVGSSGIDQVRGSVRMSLEGDDKIYGKGGADYLQGGAGKDLIEGGNGTDWLFGQRGADTLKGGVGRDALEGGSGTDKLYGGDSNDRLLGGQDADRLYGGKGIDILRGGSGKDVIAGGNGNDRLIGERGADTFIFNANSGSDVITDFQVGIDRMDINDHRNVVIAQSGDDALVLHNGGSVLLLDVTASDLSLANGYWA